MKDTKKTSIKEKILEKLAVIGASIIGITLLMLVIYGLIFVMELATSDTSEKLYAHEKSISGNDITTYRYDREILTGSAVSNARDNVVKVLDNIKNKNIMITNYVGNDSYDMYIFNNDNECFAQSSDGYTTAIRFNNGNTVKISDEYIGYGKDMTILDLVQCVVDFMDDKHEDVSLYNMKLNLNGYEDNTYEYRLDIRSAEALHSMYSLFDKELADSMMANSTDNTHVIYCIMISGEDKISVSCMSVEDGMEYMVWSFDGYIDIPSWTLPSDIKNYDYSNINGDELLGLIENFVGTLSNDLSQYLIDSGYIDTTEGTSEVVEDTLNE